MGINIKYLSQVFVRYSIGWSMARQTDMIYSGLQTILVFAPWILTRNKSTDAFKEVFSCSIRDFTDIPFQDKCFSGVSFCHVLEHLPSRGLSSQAVSGAIHVSKCVVWFRGPIWYSKFLSSLNISFYYSKWTGNTSFVDISDIIAGMNISGITKLSAMLIKIGPRMKYFNVLLRSYTLTHAHNSLHHTHYISERF